MTERQEFSDTTVSLLFFAVRDQVWAISLFDVREVVPAQRIESIPNAIPSLAGVMNIRGEIIPVILSNMLLSGFDSESIDKNQLSYTKVLVIKIKETVTGLLVQDVHRVEVFPNNAVGPSDDAPVERDIMDFVRHTLHREGLGPVPILNTATLLDSIDSGS